jgi:hypothetical protein
MSMIRTTVFVFLEFDSVEEAREARGRIAGSGVLDRFADKHGPNIVEETDAASLTSTGADRD